MTLHTMVTRVEQTCFACPEQYEGQLANGLHFYFRYRSGWASLGIGPDNGSAICDPREVGEEIGERFQGVFDSTAQRDAVFTRLLRRRFAG